MFKRKKDKGKEVESFFEADVFVAPKQTKKEMKKAAKQPIQEVDEPVFVQDDEPVFPHPEQRKRRVHEEPREFRESIPRQRRSNRPIYQKEEPKKPLYESTEQPLDIPKQDLGEYFQTTDKQAKKYKKAPKVERPQEKKLSKKARKRQLEMDLYEGYAIQYKDQVFRDVPSFIEYLHKHYISIDKVASEVFDNEKFFAWLKKHSDQFDTSLVEYKEIEQKIENQ